MIATIRFLRIPIRPVAWTSSLLGLTLTAIVWNDPCATGPMASLVGLMWIGIGLVAVVTMATLVSSSPQPWERAAGIGVLIIGAAPNLILFAGIALGGLSTC